MSRRRLSPLFWLCSALALTLILGGCTAGGQFDPTEVLSTDIFNNKKKLQGDREPLFPNGVPGVETGVPPDLIKGYQPPPDQAANADAAVPAQAPGKPAPAATGAQPAPATTAAHPAPKPEAKAKPKPKKPKPKPAVARASPPPAPGHDPVWDQPAAAVPGAGQPAWPSPPQAGSAQTNWPAPPTGQAQQGQTIWPNPPAPAPSSH